MGFREIASRMKILMIDIQLLELQIIAQAYQYPEIILLGDSAFCVCNRLSCSV